MSNTQLKILRANILLKFERMSMYTVNELHTLLQKTQAVHTALHNLLETSLTITEHI